MNMAKRPYPPSWVDRFIEWIESLPIPVWLTYLIIYLLAVGGLQVAVWIDGVTPVGQIDSLWIFNGVWAVISLGFIHALERRAETAIARFAPLVPKKQEQLDDLRYRMTTMPARAVLVMSLAFALLMVVVVAFQPEFLYEGLQHPISIVLSVGVLAFSYSLAPVLLYQAGRLLKYVTDVYKLVDRVNIFHQQPLYSFSGLTMQASLFWIVMANLNVIQNALGGLSESEYLFNIAFSTVLITLAFLTFLLPLWGIHRRLAEAKQDVLEENSIQVQSAQKKLYAAIEAEDYAKVNGLDSAIGSLYKVRDQLKSIPTWPWATGTFRSFLSAIFLPMVLWVLQTLASRYL
jgi:uncharacterized membrane protein (DUF485 family)